MEDLYSVFISHEERDEELRQKLIDATLELETMKNVKMELFNLLKMAYQERDEARSQLQELMNNNFIPSSPIQTESLVMLPVAKSTSSITESKSLSHGSPQVDSSFFDAVSSPEFSNINVVVDSNNNNNNNNNIGCYLNSNHMVQDFNCSKHDPENEIIESLAKGKVLPQKGKLLQAVMDAGPLLQTVLLAGPLPSWRNPPPLQQIKVPHFNIKDYDATTNMELNSFLDNRNNSSTKQKVPPPSLYSSIALSKCSASMLNFGGNNPGLSWNNNAWKLTSGSSFRFQVPSKKRQRHF